MLEVIVSRTNFISSHTSKAVRVVGLSTALANARDLADWLGIKQVTRPLCLGPGGLPNLTLSILSVQQVGLFNFRPSVRPVPLEVHIHGFPGQHYCPRMASMNKPTFQGGWTLSELNRSRNSVFWKLWLVNLLWIDLQRSAAIHRPSPC